MLSFNFIDSAENDVLVLT